MTTQPLSALTMLLSRHTRRREFITFVGGAAPRGHWRHARSSRRCRLSDFSANERRNACLLPLDPATAFRADVVGVTHICRRNKLLRRQITVTAWCVTDIRIRERENRKFIQAPAPEIWRKTISGGEGRLLVRKWGGLFWATSSEKIIGGVIAMISFRPGGWMQQSTVPRCAILLVGSTRGIGR